MAIIVSSIKQSLHTVTHRALKRGGADGPGVTIIINGEVIIKGNLCQNILSIPCYLYAFKS